MLSKAVQLEWLTVETLDRYRLLAPAGLNQAQQIGGPLRHWQAPGCHALGIHLFGLPMGLLLLQTRGPAWRRSAEAISLAIGEPFRRQGLASRLLETAFQSCKAAGIHSISLSYPLNQPFEAAMARLCQPAQGWKPAGGTVLYSCKVADVPAFLESLRPFSQRMHARTGLTCMPYREINVLQELWANLWLHPPAWAMPTMPQSRDSGWGRFDPLCSQALMDGTTLVGWCLCHRISSTAHRISIAYVAEDLQSKGCLVLPVMNAVDAVASLAQRLSSGNEHGILFGVRHENKAMIRFAQRRIHPFSRSMTETVEMARLL